MTYLEQALVIRAIRAESESDLNGAALAVLRHNVMSGDHADHPAIAQVGAVEAAIMALTIADMPPAQDKTATLLETLSQRLGGMGHARAWQAIGIKPGRGRDLLSRNAGVVNWPIWKTLRDAALKGDIQPEFPHQEEEARNGAAS